MANSPTSPSSPTPELESGYVSGASSHTSIPSIIFTKPHLKFINAQLSTLEPEAILTWALLTLPSLHQTTAFGLSGLVTLDILSRITSSPPPLIFLDTLHHFPETLALTSRLQSRYPNLKLHSFTPLNLSTAEQFAAQHGEQLWDKDPDMYDWVAKVEPAQRAYAELGVKAVLTGRRRSQGGKRGDLDIVEVDDQGIVKVNPLANWAFDTVQAYVKEHNVPYNELLDRGYKSVGDWHSTKPIKEGEDERSGRWQGQTKTECGIHNPTSNFARILREQEAKEKEEQLAEKFGSTADLAVNLQMVSA